MIDLGLAKMTLIGVVALIVIGPEKLPRVARMAGTLFGRAQRYLGDVKAQVSREIELDEMKRLRQEITNGAQELEQSVTDEAAHIENSIYGDDDYTAPRYQDPRALFDKVKKFRRRKMARTTALPEWYKHRHGVSSHIISGSARMARHRAKSQAPSSFF